MELQDTDLNVLKNIISNRKYAIEFAQNESESLFPIDAHRFAKIIIDYIKIYKDTPTRKILIDKIRASNNEALLNYIDNLYLKIEKYDHSEKEYKHDIEKLKIRYKNYLIQNLQTVLQKEDISANKQLSEIQSTLSSIKNIDGKKVYEQMSLKDGIDKFVARLVARKNNPKLEQGIQTGFTTLDYITNGFSSPEYVIVAGATGQGKSTLLLSLGAQIYLQDNSIEHEKFLGDGKSILYFSLEMPWQECQDRLISSLSNIPLRTIKSGQLSDDQTKKLNKTLKFIKNYKYDFEIADIPRGANINQLETIYNDICERKTKPDVVIVDYLNIMDHDNDKLDDWLRQEMISEDLWTFTRVNNLVLLTGVQLNEVRPEKTNDQQIGIHRIGRAKGIMKPCSLGIQLEKRIGEENYPTINCHIIKNRRGPMGKFTLRKNFECCSFTNDTIINDLEGQNTSDISSVMENFDINKKE